jgi:hypothetical protein
MFRAPAAIDALEDRLNTSIEFFFTRHNGGRAKWHVTANSSKGTFGRGDSIVEASQDLLIRLGLETE